MSFTPATMPWFAAHELRLAWRDFAAMATGGRRTRAVVLVAVLLAVAGVLHLLAYSTVAPWVVMAVWIL